LLLRLSHLEITSRRRFYYMGAGKRCLLDIYLIYALIHIDAQYTVIVKHLV